MGYKREREGKRNRVLLPDRVAVCRVLGQVLEQLQQGHLDALLGGHVGVAQQLVERLPDVPVRVLQGRMGHRSGPPRLGLGYVCVILFLDRYIFGAGISTIEHFSIHDRDGVCFGEDWKCGERKRGRMTCSKGPGPDLNPGRHEVSGACNGPVRHQGTPMSLFLC